jgi:hypothetical protein
MAKHRIIVMREAFVLVERVRYLGQRLSEILLEQLLIGHIVGHLAQPVHVVAERDQPRRRAAGQLPISVADEGRAGHFVERADMRQA